MRTDTVWLVTCTAVYDHGVCFVGRTLTEAVSFCDAHRPDDDGHHRWRINEKPVGVPVDGEYPVFTAAQAAERLAAANDRARQHGYRPRPDPGQTPVEVVRL